MDSLCSRFCDTLERIIIDRVVIEINRIGGLGGEAPNKLLKGPSGKAGGPFNVACKIGDGF